MSNPGELIIEPHGGTPADACVFILHGLGADGHDFPPIVGEMRLDPALAIRWVFPHAPAIPVTINEMDITSSMFSPVKENKHHSSPTHSFASPPPMMHNFQA